MIAVVSGELVLIIVLLAINFILCLKQIPKDFPIINMIFGIFTMLISLAFFTNGDIAGNPYISLLLALTGLIQFLLAFLGTKI